MNVYFLVEGKRCERKLYPAWLSVIAPHLSQVSNPKAVSHNNYYLISGEGYPSLLYTHLPNAIRDIQRIGNFDRLVVVLDADDDTVRDRIEHVKKAAANSGERLVSATLNVIVQNRCIETWLLGNRKIFKRNPQNLQLRNYIQHYDVQENDPEDMPLYDGFNSHGQFHFDYLRHVFRERNLSYTKTRPGHAAEAPYLRELRHRVTEFTGHLESFGEFLNLCEQL
ncbi:MAG: DUF4276 family protein [Candidatus Hydrogenedentota bacterium]